MLNIISKAIKQNAIDIYLKAGKKPYIRTKDGLFVLDDEIIGAGDMAEFCTKVLGQNGLNGYEADVGISVDMRRLRAHFYKSADGLCAALRLLPKEAPYIDKYPDILKQVASKPSGLVLVVGATGSGKSTTLAAMLEWINLNQAKHIVTIEDPVEFVFNPVKSIFSQRGVGSDCASYEEGLRSALRQAPDVIMLGEIRDASTLKAALSAAETGHLVLASMHAPSAVSAVIKAIAMSGQDEKIIRASLAQNLLAIIYQRLVPSTSDGRLAICEVLAKTSATANLIREGKTGELASAMQLTREAGSILFDEAVDLALRDGKISEKTAMSLKNI